MNIDSTTGPKLIHRVELTLPDLPSQLEGIRVVHISDLHVRRLRARHRRVVAGLGLIEVDLAVLTGDYIDAPGDEGIGLAVLTQICQAINPRIATFGVFGNHDTPKLRQQARNLPIHWLQDSGHKPAGWPLEIIGFDAGRYHQPDAVATLEHLANIGINHAADPSTTTNQPDRTIRVLLSHYPTCLPTAADMGIDLMFAGHTHGGQLRLPGSRSLHNSTDLPDTLTSGVLRHRQTLCVISRGLGESILPLRTFCPPHIPLYTLRRGPMLGQPTDHIENVLPW